MRTKVVSSQQKLRGTLKDRTQQETPGKPPGGFEPKDTERRLRWVEQLTGHDLKGMPLPRVDEIKGLIENHVGFLPLPMSIASPLVIHGDYARGEFIVPLCTLETALTLSMNRGLLAMATGGWLPDDSPQARAELQPRILPADHHRDRQLSQLDQRSRRFHPGGG